jgi:hypothetical protein
MPFKNVEDAVKKHPNLKKYSAKAQRAWVSAINSCFDGGGDDSKCFPIAYAAANRVDGKKTTKSHIANELVKIANLITGALRLTPEDIGEYAITFARKPVSASKVNSILGRSIQSESELPFLMEVREGRWGIGDVAVPKKGKFKGIPLSVQGFGGPKMKIDPFSGLHYGSANRLICELMYKDGTDTGVRLYIPTSEMR